MWIITKDFISKPEDDDISRAGDTSSNFNPEKFEKEKEKDYYQFRLLDDDETVYFEGLISVSDIEGTEEQAFDPLDSYQGIYGVTIMQYKKPNEETWETL